MNALIVFSALVAAANAGIIAAPYAGAYAGLPYAGAYGGYAGAYGAYAGAYGAPLAYAHAPVIAKAAPVAVAVAAPVAPAVHSSQYQAQDEFGNVNYGYSNINSAKQEVGNAYTGVAGSYKYVDANGIPQRVDYVADDLGFRITGATNLPVAPLVKAAVPLVGPVFTGVAPEPVVDTPEVAAAKAEFFAAFEEASRLKKRSVAFAAPAFGAYPYAAYTQTGAVAGPIAPAHGDLVATPRGARPLSLEGFSEDLNQDGFVDPIGQVAYAAPVAHATYAAAPIAHATYVAAPVAHATYAAPAIAAAPVAVAAATYAAPAVAAAPIAAGFGLPAPAFDAVSAATYAAGPAIAGPLGYAGQVVSAPAARDAVLETVKLNPGHAVAYRVY